MVISEIGIRGYKSFGNNEQTLKVSTEEGQLVLLVGNNGNGKCVHETTSICVDIEDLSITDELINYLETTESGKKIFLYIKENKKDLYEKIEKNRKKQKTIR